MEETVEAKVFGEVLRKLRESSGQTQDALAENANLNRTFISFMERGLRQPTLRTLFLLANALNLRASQIVAKVEQHLSKRGRRV